MDLKKMLQKGHSKTLRNAIVEYIGANPTRFKALVEVYLKGPYEITQRAAWPLSVCVEQEPSLIYPHLRKVLKFLQVPDIHDAVKRNTMRLLQFVEIPRRYHGEVIELCFEYIQNPKVAVAIRVCSMTVLSRIIEGQPDLIKEFKILLEDQLPYGSPAFISRAKKVMQEMP
jgi:hypothetical protein